MSVAKWVVVAFGVLVILAGVGIAVAWTVALDRAHEARRFAAFPLLRSVTTIGGGVILVLLGFGDTNRVIVTIVGLLVVASWVIHGWLRRRWAGDATGRA
jgi:hypothetical protein